MPHLIVSLAIAIIAVMTTTVFHYEAVHHLDIFSRRSRHQRHCRMILIIFCVIAIHITHIVFYAFLYKLAIGYLELGRITGLDVSDTSNLFYFAAETYSSLGQGDFLPTGSIRYISSISCLNGILLLAWSGSFLFRLAHLQLDSGQ